MRWLWKAYRKYKLLMWISSILTGIVLPVAGYVLAWVKNKRQVAGLQEDNPELVSSSKLPDFMGWLHTVPWLTVIIIIMGVLILLLLAIQVYGAVQSEKDKPGTASVSSPVEETDTDSDDDYSDYGKENDD